MSQARLSSISFGDRVLDRLKLQFLAAGNWKAELAGSGLPEEVQTVIRQVVSQTGLLRFEKAEIARELINHFQDGHDRDRSWESLIEDFGKIDVAVSLFRSSKLRSRPMSVKAFRGSFYALSGGLLSYLVLQLFFHSAVPTPSVDYGEMSQSRPSLQLPSNSRLGRIIASCTLSTDLSKEASRPVNCSKTFMSREMDTAGWHDLRTNNGARQLPSSNQLKSF